MPNAEEIEIIQGLLSGGIERRRFENALWKRFLNFMHWGRTKYKLPTDEIRHAYGDAISSVIINIVSGKYQQDPNTLLKTYAERIFHNKCIDRINQTNKNSNANNPERISLNNPQPIKESLSDTMPDEVKIAIDEIIEREDQLKMKTCLEKTGEVCKEVLRYYAAGYKDKEIAVIMKYSSSDVVKQTRYRCMEKLSEYYLNMYKYE